MNENYIFSPEVRMYSDWVDLDGQPETTRCGVMFRRIRDLPEAERHPFSLWLNGQTMPWLDGVPSHEQDGYYLHDYERWKRGLPVVD